MKSRHLLLLGTAGLAVILLLLTEKGVLPAETSGLTQSPRKLVRQPTSPAPAPFEVVQQSLQPPESPFSSFDSWASSYLAASPSDREVLVAAGTALAQTRRETMAALIRSDPRAALAAAVPLAVRSELPAEILGLLEERVSGSSALSLTYRCFGEGNDHSRHDHAPVRTTVLNNRQYEVHTYGSRLVGASVPATSFHGIAVGRDLAVSDQRHRVLEAGETAGELPFAESPLAAGLSSSPLNLAGSPVAVEAGGEIHLFRSRNEIPSFEAALRQRETVNLADNQPGTSTVVGRPSQDWTHGPKKVLVIRVEFSDLTGIPINVYDNNAPVTDTYISNVMNGPGGVAKFIAASSFGKSSLVLAPAVGGDSPDVTPVFLMPNTGQSYATSGDSELLHLHAREAADAAGFNLDAYDRIGVVFSRLSEFTGSKITYGGLGNLIGPHFWVNAAFDLRLVSHELGHTYGLEHSNLWKVTDGNPVSESGKSREYGDPFDIMGDGDVFEHDFSPWNKSILQWIPDSAVTVAQAGGTFRIRRFDSAGANLNRSRALKIVRDSTRDYWIGYRRATDSALMDNGAYVTWGYNENGKGNLLDLNTPNTNPDDAALPLGQTFNDTAAGITITPLAQGGTGSEEWLDVQVAFQPRIGWTSNTFVINEQGGSAVLTLKRDGNSSGSVTLNYATTPGTAVSPADFTASSGSVSWANGDSADKTITIPIVADTEAEGSQNFTVTLSAISGGVIVGGATATVTLADPGARDTSFTADFVNNSILRVLPQPDGSLYIAGYFSEPQDSNPNNDLKGRILLMKSNGAEDPSFNPGFGANDVVRSASVLPDGKILIVGDFTSYNGTTRNRIARLYPSGALDTTFNPGTGANGAVREVLPLPDGKILIGGSFTSYNGTAREYLARLNVNGSLDTTFTGPDFGGTTGWSVHKIAVQTDGKLLVGGVFFFSGASSSLCRLNTNGTRDTSFNGLTSIGNIFAGGGFTGEINDLLIQPDGKILVAGDFVSFNGNTSMAGLVRLTDTGALDTTFTARANNAVNSLVMLPDGRLMAGGDFTSINGGAATRIARLSATGARDSGFAAAGGHAGIVYTLALQADGKVLLGGDFDFFQGASTDGPLWRFHAGLPALPGTLEISADTFSGAEGTPAVLTVTRTGGTAGAISVSYATVSGSATAADFSATSGLLSWTDGDASAKTITVPLTADSLSESPETFVVNLGAPTLGSAILGGRRQATVTVASAFFNWQSENFTSAEMTNPLVSGDTADPDGDGLSNLLEFATGSAPRASGPDRLPSTSIVNVSGTNYLTLNLRRRLGSSDLAYVVQTTPSPSGPWTSNAVQVGSPVSQGDGTEIVVFRDSTTSTGTTRFMRVLITRTP